MSSPGTVGTPRLGYEREFERLAEGLVRGEIGFLFGAGMSCDSGVKSGGELAKLMLREATGGHTLVEATGVVQVVDELAGRYPFEAISDYLRRELTDHNVVRWLKEKGGFNKPKPNKAHEGLHSIRRTLGHRFPGILFTTNFDNCIEDQFNKEAKEESENDAICITEKNIGDLAEARRSRKVAVVHLHGSINNPETIIVGEQQLATSEGPLFDLFRSEFSKEVFVLVGYSLADTNMRRIFFDVQRVATARAGLKKRTFVVSRAPGDPSDPKSEAGIAKVIWDNRGENRGDMTHLAMTAKEFFDSMVLATDNFVELRVRERVAAALKVDRETLGAMLETAAKPFDLLDPVDFLFYLYYTLTPWDESTAS